MALYQDLIMDQIKNIGKPRESKSTTTTTAEPPNEGMDIGGLMMMLMMMNMFKDPNAAGGLASTLGPEAVPVATSTLFPNIQQQAPSTLQSTPFGGGGQDMLSMLLMALMGGQGAGGQGFPGMPIGGQVPGSPF